MPSYDITISGKYPLTMDITIEKITDSDNKKLDILESWVQSDGSVVIVLSNLVASKEETELINYLRAKGISTRQELLNLIANNDELPF